MVRFLVLDQRPTGVPAFERHYVDVHVPLAKKLPGLRKYPLSRSVTAVRGPEAYYLVAELDWDDMASLQRDFASPIGQATRKDVEKLEALCQGVQSMILELETL